MKRGRCEDEEGGNDDAGDGPVIPAMYVKPAPQVNDLPAVLAALNLNAIDVDAWLTPGAQSVDCDAM
jgi:hypothetical protein